MFLKRLTLALGLTFGASAAIAAGGYGETIDYDFSFEGPFGTYDQAQLQRGLQIYTEACAGCHGLRYVPIRTLSDKTGPGIPAAQVRAYAERVFVSDGEGGLRPALTSDNFPQNTSAGAPDLSLMAKARAGWSGPLGSGINQFFRGMGGAEYIASVLSGYTGEEKTEAGSTLWKNTAFQGGSYISMQPPLFDGQMEFADGSPNDVESMAQDVAAFLMWTAEPKLQQRKQAGLTAVLFMTVLAVLLYLTNKALWAPIKNPGRFKK